MTVSVLWLLVPCVGLQCVIVVFLDLSHVPFWNMTFRVALIIKMTPECSSFSVCLLLCAPYTNLANIIFSHMSYML